MDHQRVGAAQGERQSFGPPVRGLQDVNLETKVLEREPAREGSFQAKCCPWQPTADLGKPSPNAPPVQAYALSHGVLESLPWGAGENMNLVSTGGKGPCHRLHVRSETSAAGLRRVLL